MAETNKVLETITMGADVNPNGLEVAFSFTVSPQPPQKQGQLPMYKIVLRVNAQEKAAISAIFERYQAHIDSLFPNTVRKTNYFKPDKDKAGVAKPDSWLIGFENAYPIRLWDKNNNEVTPAIQVTAGSRVQLVFGILPFEFNGQHGISLKRLYQSQIMELGQGAHDNPFGESTGAPLLNNVSQGQPAPQQQPAFNQQQPVQQQQPAFNQQQPTQQQGGFGTQEQAPAFDGGGADNPNLPTAPNFQS